MYMTLLTSLLQIQETYQAVKKMINIALSKMAI